MKGCSRQNEVTQALQAGQWPQGCAQELHDHVETCRQCGEQVRFTLAFAAARNAAMRAAMPQSAGLLWWKAQLRRRQQAMERLERPGAAIPTATLTASVVLLAVALLAIGKHLDWAQWATLFSPAGWNIWVVAAIAAALCGFAVVAVVVGMGLAEERG